MSDLEFEHRLAGHQIRCALYSTPLLFQGAGYCTESVGFILKLDMNPSGDYSVDRIKGNNKNNAL